jgi:hypothetical protein
MTFDPLSFIRLMQNNSQLLIPHHHDSSQQTMTFGSLSRIVANNPIATMTTASFTLTLPLHPNWFFLT